jgi:hypothetical protein
MKREVRGRAPAYVVLVDHRSSWGAVPGSDTRILTWAAEFTARCYDRVGIAEVDAGRGAKTGVGRRRRELPAWRQAAHDHASPQARWSMLTMGGLAVDDGSSGCARERTITFAAPGGLERPDSRAVSCDSSGISHATHCRRRHAKLCVP